jgi:hypothetical protein
MGSPLVIVYLNPAGRCFKGVNPMLALVHHLQKNIILAPHAEF